PLGEYAYPYLADTQLRLGKPDKALASFRRALEFAPKGKLAEDCRFGMARALEALGRRADARTIYRQIAADPAGSRAAEAAFRLATLDFEAGDLAAAARRFDRLEERFPSSTLVPAARLNAGYAYYGLKDYPTAAARFEKARQSPNQAVTAGYWLALCWKAQKKYDRALAVLSGLDIRRATPEVAEGIAFQIADCQLRNGRYDDAAKQFQQVTQKWPQGEFADDSLLFAAEAWLLAGHVDTAQGLLKEFPKRFPGSSLRLYAQLLQGRCLAATGEADALRRALELFRGVATQSQVPRTRALARMHWARTLLKLDRPKEAADTLVPLQDELRKDEKLSAEFDEA
ncbi:MAG TPA: tetratricopeptide repeat protein, partial [Planctomycetaceae bacterium]|nr:tetratricopeptide repeat protein [Planctomycetaceae bacterium]